MKKRLLFVIAALMLCFGANAQGFNGKRQAIGIRGGWGAELSYQRYVAPENRFEGTIGVNRFGFSVEGIYHWMSDINSSAPGEFKWYAGAGIGLGAWSHKDYKTGFSTGVPGQIGIEYSFAKVPLMLSVDYRPGFYFVPEFNFDWSGLALGLRYCF